MKIATTLFLFVVAGCTWREAMGTCVFESDFGLSINCAFKKSGLFRVRNLGGVKGYVGLGFSLGDELGFPESLTNLETSRRRSLQSRSGMTYGPSNGAQRTAHIPPFKPLPPGAVRPFAQQPELQRLVVQQNSSNVNQKPAPSIYAIQEQALRQQQLRNQQEAKLLQQHRLQQEILAKQILKQQRLQQQEAMRLQQKQKAKNQQQLLGLATSQNQRIQNVGSLDLPSQLPTVVAAIPPSPVYPGPDKVLASKPLPGGLPPFILMPATGVNDRISNGPIFDGLENSVNEVTKDNPQIPPSNDDVTSSVNQMTMLSLHPVYAENQSLPQQQDKRQSVRPGSLPSLEPIHGMETSLKVLADASNITLEALEAAILLRQQQLLQRQKGPGTTTTTTTTEAPVKNKNNNGATKVMNAPREYYPVGYDKNFDDNFASRVDLPDTTFYCGDQKHFPGLYADEDLGCMVFHVCALTDEGLIMKSFLCPESTLFDQTILKCNWWFYVDCKTSRSLYDSNIPISKSYQLMKALAFFSAYKSHDNSTTTAKTNKSSEEST